MEVKIISKATLAKEHAKATAKEGFDIRQHVRVARGVAEFIGTGNFAKQFYERQRFEVDAGRDSEPLLYLPIYETTNDPNLPRHIPTNTLGTTGVVFEKVLEGGEVKFATIGEGSKTVEIFHYAVGLEYSEDIFVYNELFRLPVIERQFGIAHNALLNNIHFSPILGHTYSGANQTAAVSEGTTLPERYLRTFEKGISDSVKDTTNPRRGPYILVCATANVFTIERALKSVAQQGFDLQSSAMGRIQQVIAYDGWTGTRGKKQTTYAGVTAGKCYLVDISNKAIDFQSWVKQLFRRQLGEADHSRFILEQVIWDSRLGSFADPVRAVQEITLPTMA